MKRSEQAERIRHTDWLQRWETGIVAEDRRWFKIVMTCFLAAVIFVLLVYVAGATVLR
jgi:hypothetical protein